MKTLNIASIVAVLAIAVTLASCTNTNTTGEFHPKNDPWWTQEPIYRGGQLVGYAPQQTDGDELLVGQGDGEEPAACTNGRAEDDGTCLAGSGQRRFAQGDPTGRYYRPLTPSGQ